MNDSIRHVSRNCSRIAHQARSIVRRPVLRGASERLSVDAWTLFAAGAVWMAVITGGPAGAESSETHPASRTDPSRAVTHRSSSARGGCALRYHQALQGRVSEAARATKAAAGQLRKPLPGRPGYWLFWDGSGILARTARQKRLLAAPILNWRENRMCVRSILARGGRIRCLKWKPIPKGYEPPEPELPAVDPGKLKISPAERRIARALARRVTRKSAFREFDFNTAMYHMAARTTDELVAYTSQSQTPSLCTGAIEMVAFYRRKLAPLKKIRLQAVMLRRETVVAAQRTIDMALATWRPERPQPRTAPHHLSDDTNSDARAALRTAFNELLSKTMSPSEHQQVRSRKEPIEMLSLTREILTDQRLKKMDARHRGATVKALRNLEFSLYALDNEAGLSRLDDAFEATLRAILAAHERECRCGS